MRRIQLISLILIACLPLLSFANATLIQPPQNLNHQVHCPAQLQQNNNGQCRFMRAQKINNTATTLCGTNVSGVAFTVFMGSIETERYIDYYCCQPTMEWVPTVNCQ